jgi:hypothetical protein
MATLARSLGICLTLGLAASLLPLRVAAEPPAITTTSPEANVAAGPRLTIASETTCPSGAAVADALAALCPPDEWPTGFVRIQTVADGLLVDLAFDESTRREVHVGADCGLRAGTVALVIATWTGKLASDAAGTPVLPNQPARDAGEVPSKPAPLPVAPVERELGVGLLLAMTGGLAPGLTIDLVQSRAPRGLGWQANLTLPARRERDAAGGTTRWTRPSASVAVNGRVTRGRLVLSVATGLVGAYTLTDGQGYSIEQGWQALTGGVAAGARLALPWRRLRAWTEVRGTKWLFSQTVAVDSMAGGRVATVGLPSWDLQWAAGISYLFR